MEKILIKTISVSTKNIANSFFVLALIFFSSASVQAQAKLYEPPVPVPLKSPSATVSQRIGVTHVSISYSRPQVRGRTLWGGLVPYGYGSRNYHTGKRSSPWHTGANESSFIQFPHPVTIGGTELPPGKYSIFMAVFEDGEVEVILSKDVSMAGSTYYNKENDAVRFRAKSEKVNFREFLTFEFDNITTSSAEISLIWGEKKIPFTITVDTHKQVINELLAHQYTEAWETASWRQRAAAYCMNNNVYLEHGLRWAKEAVDLKIYGKRTFVNLTTYANILLMTGKSEKAGKILDEAFSLPPEDTRAGTLNFYGNQALRVGKGYPDVSIRAFNLLEQRFPKTAWYAKNGLAKAYSAKGDFKTALKHLQEAKQFAPEKYNVDAYESQILKLKNNKDIN